jgi:hypothetical protein
VPVAVGLSGMDVGVTVALGGMGVEVNIGTAVSVDETTSTAGAHEIRMRVISKAMAIVFIFIITYPLQETAQLCTEL